MMLGMFLATLAALAVFMLALGLGAMLGRRKRECSCKASARIMATKKAETRFLTIETPRARTSTDTSRDAEGETDRPA